MQEEEESSDDEGPFPEPYPVKRIPVKYYCCSSDSLDSSDSDSEESNASPGEDRNRTRGEAEIKASQEPKIVCMGIYDILSNFNYFDLLFSYSAYILCDEFLIISQFVTCIMSKLFFVCTVVLLVT